MMALAGVMLVTSVADYRRFHMVEVFAALTATKIIYSFYSVLSGGKDYHQLLKYTHILLAIAVAAIIFIVLHVVVRGGLRNRFKRSLFIALFLSVMVGAADIFVYLTTPDANNRPLYFKYAMFLFTFILGVYEFYSISEMSRKSQYAEIMESLAYGYSVYVPGENVAEECIREADKKMYDMKIKMKAARI